MPRGPLVFSPFSYFMSDKRKIIVVVVCMVVFVTLSVFFWLRFNMWFCLLPGAVVLLAWHALQCRKAMRVKGVKWLIRLKKLKWFARKVQLPVAFGPEPKVASVVTSIADLLLKDFITCCVYHDLSVLGTGTADELNGEFTNLLSQYYEVKNDERVKYEVKLRKDIATLELRKHRVDVLSSILKERYSVAAADGLRVLYPNYEITEQTLAHDLGMIGKGEISKELEHNRACNKLESLYAQKQNDKKESPEKQYRNFISRLMDINKVEGVRYNMQTITVMEYAIAEARLADHVANLKEQANGRR